MADSFILPPLRRDLILHAGPAQPGGEKSWTLHDPASNRFFRIGWPEFEALRRFNLVKTARELCALIRKETPLAVDEAEIRDISRFLAANDLVLQPASGGAGRFAALRKQRRKPLFLQILHHYLFFTIPLLRPQRLLKTAFPYAAPLFGRGFFIVMMILLGAGLALTVQRWDEFMATAVASLTWEGLVVGGLTLVGVKIVHEAAHALMATKYGVRVASLGIAFMVLYPVLYTETSGAWKLTSQKQRLLIGAAGMLAELCLAALALWAWHIAPEGPWKSAAFFVAVISLAGTLAINLNPLMRFDGYFLLSDALGMDNLQGRGFALARWNLRRVLFGWNDPAPETLSPRLHRIVLTYAYAAWAYRFVLFMGIALLVYHLFFQPLGTFLMAVELGWFIGLPVWNEVKVWIQRRDAMNWNPKSRRTAWIAAFIILFLFVPWQSRVDVPAIAVAQRYESLYPPAIAQVEDIRVRDGEYVKNGQILVVLRSPALDHKRALARADLDKLELRARSLRVSTALAADSAVLESRVNEAKARLDGLIRQQEQLTLTAAFDGQVRDLQPFLRAGQWADPGKPLLRVAGSGGTVLYGYVREADLRRIETGANGTFYAAGGLVPPLSVSLAGVQETNTPALEWPALAAPYGGAIEVFPPPRPDAPLIPRESLYAVRLEARNPPASGTYYKLAGRAVLQGKRESIAGNALRRFAALALHELNL